MQSLPLWCHQEPLWKPCFRIGSAHVHLSQSWASIGSHSVIGLHLWHGGWCRLQRSPAGLRDRAGWRVWNRARGLVGGKQEEADSEVLCWHRLGQPPQGCGEGRAVGSEGDSCVCTRLLAGPTPHFWDRGAGSGPRSKNYRKSGVVLTGWGVWQPWACVGSSLEKRSSQGSWHFPRPLKQTGFLVPPVLHSQPRTPALSWQKFLN